MTRILLIASIRLYREGLAHLLSRHERLTIIDAPADVWDALANLTELAPDVILLDMATPESDVMARGIRNSVPATPFVVIGIADSDADVLACAELGAAGYVTRDGSVDELVAAVQSAARGELICSPRTAGQLARRLAALAAQRDASTTPARLTPRECEIAALIQENLSNKEIAVRLHIEVATVKNHVHNVLEKLQVSRRAEAARAVRHTLNLPPAVAAGSAARSRD